MIDLHGRRGPSRGFLGSLGVRRTKIGSREKTPAYILAQNTCLKFVVGTFVLIGVIVLVLGTTIYKVERRSRVAEFETENEKILSRMEERSAHHRLIETHVNLKNALNGQVEDFNEVAEYMAHVENEINDFKSNMPADLQPTIEIFQERVLNLTHELVDGMSIRAKRATELFQHSESLTKTEIRRDQHEESEYHDFFLKQKGRSHKEITELEQKAVGYEGTADESKSEEGMERDRVKLVVEGVIQWYHQQFGDSDNPNPKYRGLMQAVKKNPSELKKRKKFAEKVEKTLMAEAVGKSIDRGELRAQSHAMIDDMEIMQWNEAEGINSRDIREIAKCYKKMIESGMVLLNAKAIENIEKRYRRNKDVYQAMDGIEALMAEGGIPHDIINKAYTRVRDKEHRCRYKKHSVKMLKGILKVGVSTAFKTVEHAQNMCSKMDKCGGVTSIGNGIQAYTLRSGLKLYDSKNNQTSWLKDCTKSINTEEQIVQAQAEAIAGF